MSSNPFALPGSGASDSRSMKKAEADEPIARIAQTSSIAPATLRDRSNPAMRLPKMLVTVAATLNRPAVWCETYI
ncbi:hypothetical protein CQZ93_15370 [Ochrobactrum vermis]|nr:hypothetical protein CQZ93_15370 [Ochrobactrum vermis]